MNWTSFTSVCLLSAAIGAVGCERETAEGNGADRLLPAAQSQHEDPPSGQTKREELHADHDHAARDDGDAGGEHAGHDHAADEHHEDAEPEQDVHADDVHDVHEGHDHADHDHGDEATTVVSLTPQERQRLHVEIATASAGTLSRSAVFPGEIVANEDRMVHIVPRAGGIVREVAVTLGDRVDEGQALAWIESAQLARAKLDFYAAHTEVASRSIELPRARQIHDSTTKLLALLETEPDVEALEQLDEAEMGEFRGQLITAYAEYRAAKKTFERERGLYEKNVASESDYIEAEAAYKIARAAFTAARDIARYQSLMQYAEAAQERQVAEFEAVSAGQHLRLLGVDEKTIEDLLALVPRPRQGEGETRSVLEALGGEVRLG